MTRPPVFSDIQPPNQKTKEETLLIELRAKICTHPDGTVAIEFFPGSPAQAEQLYGGIRPLLSDAVEKPLSTRMRQGREPSGSLMLLISTAE
ncbi:hypothetical protein C4587_02250 [Candidatus Parcubacteria bacterium]|nr:MAG: hypothetical protein C4587_02250 [Candidatus Parcubacteria bacterium]